MYNNHLLFKILFIAFLLCLPLTSYGADKGISDEIDKQKAEEIFSFYGTLSSLSFDFQQLTETTARTRSGEGNALFFRPANSPGLMRWNYTAPDRQVVINDGHDISIYTEKDKQMIVTTAGELESDVTYQLLNGNSDILDDFLVEFSKSATAENKETGYQSIKLTPKEVQNQLKTIQFWVDTHNTIHQVVIIDHFETITTLRFTNISINSLQADDPAALSTIIDFTPPTDTEIIRHQ